MKVKTKIICYDLATIPGVIVAHLIATLYLHSSASATIRKQW